MKLENDIELKSEEIQEIIGRIPHWIIRSGITMICLLVVLLLTGSWIFKYADIIAAPIVIDLENLQEENKSESQKIIGRISIPSGSIGRIKPGQLVHIKFDRYPHTEFGIISGIIRSISSTPQDDTYIAIVDLPNGLNTNYGKELKLESGLRGLAEIVTEELRLIERIIQPLSLLLNKTEKAA